MSLFKKKEREPIPVVDLEIKPLLETVFLPEWNTTAQLCEDGTIYIMFIVGRYHSKGDLMKDELMHPYYTNKELLQLFYQLEKYMNIKYENLPPKTIDSDVDFVKITAIASRVSDKHPYSFECVHGLVRKTNIIWNYPNNLEEVVNKSLDFASRYNVDIVNVSSEYYHLMNT